MVSMKQCVSHGALLSFLCALLTVGVSGKRQSNLRKLQPNPQVPIGFQSGPDPGPTFGGKIIYRPDSHRLYVTGASYGNYFKSADTSNENAGKSDSASCFLGIALLPAADDAKELLQWQHSEQWDTLVQEACNGIHIDTNPLNLPENNTNVKEKIYLLGYTGVGGMMESLRLESTFPADQYGMIIDIDIDVVDVVDGEPDDPFVTTWWGGRLLQDGPVQCPIDLTMDEEGYLYVASMQSFDSNPSSDLKHFATVKQTVDPRIPPFGSDYAMLIQQFLYDNPAYDDGIGLPQDPDNIELQTTLVDNWRKPYSPTSGTGGASVAGIQYMGGVLVVVGSTTGHSQVFGNEIMTNSNKTDFSMDGFITKLMPASGSYYQFVVDNGAPGAADIQGPVHKRSATSIMSIDFQDDYIMGMCSSPGDPDNFYIVGTTEGQIDKSFDMMVKGEVHAFIMKINLWTLLPQWIKQIGGNPLNKDTVLGMVCAATYDGQDVYMAGIVENGGALNLWEQESKGGDDIFLFQARAGDGELVFLRQIGTAGNDRISAGGLTVDEFGNAILMGHTDGSFYRSRQYDQESEKSDDLFIMTVIRDTGDYKEPEVQDSTETFQTESDVPTQSAVIEEQPPRESNPSDVNEPAGTTETEIPVQAQGNILEDTPEEPQVEATPTVAEGQDTPTVAEGTADPLTGLSPAKAEKQKVEDDQRYGLLIFFMLLVAAGVVGGVFAYSRLNHREIQTERDVVLEYLNDFDVDDIDLKHSATGGWHCNYTNDLAHGINARAATQEGLFGPFGSKNKTSDPLLADPNTGGEISFTDENDRDDITSIGSGIASGRHSTHDALLDDSDGRRGPSKEYLHF
jgi:hypothetical protein